MTLHACPGFSALFRVPLAILPPADRAHAASWTWHSGRPGKGSANEHWGRSSTMCVGRMATSEATCVGGPENHETGSGEGVSLPSRARGRRAAGKRPLAGRAALRRAARIREYNPHQGGDPRDVELGIFGVVLAGLAV